MGGPGTGAHAAEPEGLPARTAAVPVGGDGVASRLNDLAQAARVIAGATSLDDLLRVVTETARTTVGAHRAETVRLVEDGAEGPRSHISLSDEYAGVAGHAPDGPTDLAAPLVSRDGTTIGLVKVSDRLDGTDFSTDDEAVLAHLAHMVSAAIEHVEVAARYERTVTRLGLALDAGAMGTWEWDYASDRVSWSTTLERIYGYAPGDFPGTVEAYASHIHPDDQESALATIAWARETGSRFDYAYRIRTVDGRTRWLEGGGLPLRDIDGHLTGMTGVCLDATERRRVEERLRQEHRVTESLHEVGKAVTARLDLQEVLQIVTDAATRLSGAAFGSFFYNRGDDAGESYLLYTLSGAPREAFDRFPMPRATAVFGPTFRGEGIVRLDDVTADPRYGHNPPYSGMPEGHLPVRSYLAVPVVTADGHVVGGLFFGHPTPGVFDDEAERLVTGVAAYASIALENARLYDAARRELAARQQALEERAAVATRLERTVSDLGTAEARYRDLVNSLEAVVWTATTDPELTFTFVSDRAESLLGYPGSRFVDELGFWESMIHPDDRERAVSYCASQTALGRDHEFEYRAVTADGRVVWLLDVVTVVRDEQGRTVGLQGLMVDVTRRKRAEQHAAAQLAVTRVLAESRLSGDAFDEILRGLGTTLDLDVTALWVVSGESLACTHLWSTDRSRTRDFVDTTERLRLGPGEGLVGQVWATSTAGWLEDLSTSPYFARTRSAESSGLTSGFAVPILVGGQFFGVIECFSRERLLRDDELLATMSTIVTQLGQSLGRLQAETSLEETLQSLRRRSAQLRRLAEVASAINTLGSIDEVLHTVTHEARLLVGAHQAAAGVSRPVDRAPPSTNVSLSEKYAGWLGSPGAPHGWVQRMVRHTGTAVRMTEDEAGRHVGTLANPGDAHPDEDSDCPPMRGLLAVPLDAPDGSTVGVLQLSDRYSGDFTEDDEAVLVQLGEIASAAVHKTRLYEERSRVADALQRPLRPPRLPSIPSLEVAACYEPFGEMLSVGGDFYDLFPVPSGQWVAILGDVCGKGPEAAALTGLARQTLWAGAQHSDDPSEILALLNAAILRTGSDRFATAVAVVLDPTGDALALKYASAGHPPSLVLSTSGDVRPLDGEGMLLGMFSDIGARTTTFTLEPGESLVLYSDGLTEGGGAETFDGHELRRAVSEKAGWTASEIVAGLLADVRARRAHQRDDLALLVLRATGATP